MGSSGRKQVLTFILELCGTSWENIQNVVWHREVWPARKFAFLYAYACISAHIVQMTHAYSIKALHAPPPPLHLETVGYHLACFTLHATCYPCCSTRKPPAGTGEGAIQAICQMCWL